MKSMSASELTSSSNPLQLKGKRHYFLLKWFNDNFQTMSETSELTTSVWLTFLELMLNKDLLSFY